MHRYGVKKPAWRKGQQLRVAFAPRSSNLYHHQRVRIVKVMIKKGDPRPNRYAVVPVELEPDVHFAPVWMYEDDLTDEVF